MIEGADGQGCARHRATWWKNYDVNDSVSEKQAGRSMEGVEIAKHK